MGDELKILKSYKQVVFKGQAARGTVYYNFKIVNVEGNKFSIALPDNKFLITTIESLGMENGKENFKTAAGERISISDTEIFLDLQLTHGMNCTYYLGDDPITTADKPVSKSWLRRLLGMTKNQ